MMANDMHIKKNKKKILYCQGQQYNNCGKKRSVIGEKREKKGECIGLNGKNKEGKSQETFSLGLHLQGKTFFLSLIVFGSSFLSSVQCFESMY